MHRSMFLRMLRNACCEHEVLGREPAGINLTCSHFFYFTLEHPRTQCTSRWKGTCICFKISPRLFPPPCSAILPQCKPREYHHETNSSVQKKDHAVWGLNCNYMVLVKLLYHFALINVRIEHHHAFSQLSKRTYLSAPHECCQDQSIFQQRLAQGCPSHSSGH